MEHIFKGDKRCHTNGDFLRFLGNAESELVLNLYKKKITLAFQDLSSQTKK